MALTEQLFKRAKTVLYFPFARYFRFWARLALRRWNPDIVAITGSSGKTTMLHMLEAQMGIQSFVSHGANSAFGVPLNILGLSGVKGSRKRWFKLIALAPLRAFSVQRSERYYLVEADADRPGEAKFLAKLLRPNVTVWVSSSHTHAMNFDSSGNRAEVEKSIAAEYASLAMKTGDLILADGDNPNIVQSLRLIKDKVILITDKERVKTYSVSTDTTMITLNSGTTYTLPCAQPPAVAKQVAFMDEVLKHFKMSPDYQFSRFQAPPGRSTILKGVGGITILDSTYNANLDSIKVILEMFKRFPGDHKILVVGDMLEQGKMEQSEHEKLAQLMVDLKLDAEQIVLYGRRVKAYTYPKLVKKLKKVPVSVFTDPQDVSDFLQSETKKGYVVCLKGGGFMEDIVYRLLANKEDVRLLARRGAHWDRRRAQWRKA